MARWRGGVSLGASVVSLSRRAEGSVGQGYLLERLSTGEIATAERGGLSLTGTSAGDQRGAYTRNM